MSSSETQLRFSDEEDCQFAMQLVSASVFPIAFKAAIDLGVLEIIDRAGPGTHLSPSQIASELPTQNPEAPVLLDRMLRLLASHQVLTCTLISLGDGQVQRLYGLAPVCKYFVPNQDGASLTPLLQLIQDKVFMESWCHRKDAILEGGHPFDKAYGMSVSDHMGKNPGIGKIFKCSTEDYNSMFMKKTLEIYKGFEGLKSVVDVGGGDGKILNMIISKYPEIKGINFDLPQVINNAPVYQGVEHIAGDMFESVPKGDAIFMKWILHTRNDESCLKLLKICYEALPDDGKVIVVDLVIPESPDTSVSAKGIFQFDLLNLNPDGKERSKRQFEDLAKEAGFGSVEVAWCVYDFSVIEFYKRRQWVYELLKHRHSISKVCIHSRQIYL